MRRYARFIGVHRLHEFQEVHEDLGDRDLGECSNVPLPMSFAISSRLSFSLPLVAQTARRNYHQRQHQRINHETRDRVVYALNDSVVFPIDSHGDVC